MKWFKHKTNAGDDPFIHALMEEFGPRGYWVYFRTLELMAQNFNTKSPGYLEGNWSFFRVKYKLYRNNIQKILDFCDAKHKFTVHYEGESVYIKCDKFKEMLDDYTTKLIKGKKYNYNGGYLPWNRIQHEIRSRDDYKCVICGKTTYDNNRSLAVHHIIPFDEFDDINDANNFQNLITLCQKCHGKSHTGKYDQFFKDYLARIPSKGGIEMEPEWNRHYKKRLDKNRKSINKTMDTTNGGWLGNLIPGVFKKLKRGRR